MLEKGAKMASLTVRITPKAHRSLKEISRLTGEPMPAVLDKAIDEYRRRRFLEGLSADFAALRKDAKAWRHELDERAAWDVTLADGLEEA